MTTGREDSEPFPGDEGAALNTEPRGFEAEPVRDLGFEPEFGAGPEPDGAPGVEPPDLAPATFDRQMLSTPIRLVWFIGYLIPSLVITLIVLQLDIFVLPTRTGLVTSATLVGALALSVWRTLTRYRTWSWELDETELVIDRGVVFKLTRVVPRVRVQHVDLSSGPIDRIFNLRQVSIYTAGTREADASIPGLTAERAEELRQALITRDRTP